jgi:hypothetical protein
LKVGVIPEGFESERGGEDNRGSERKEGRPAVPGWWLLQGGQGATPQKAGGDRSDDP